MGDQRLSRERPQVDCGLEDEPGEGAGSRLPERASGGILDFDPPARQLRRNAPGDRRIGRDERRGLAGRLQNFAHCDGERERLVGLVVGDDDREAIEGGRDRGGRQRRVAFAPKIGRIRGAQGFAEESRARGERGGRSAERPHLLPPDADAPDQPMQERLRMAGQPLRPVVPCADRAPGALVEMKVETGQHHCAPVAVGDRGDQLGGGAVRAGRARDDGRTEPRPGLERVDFGLHEQRDALGAVDEAVLSEPRRPVLEGDLEKVERDAPVGVVFLRRERIEPPPVDPLDDHVVDQRGEIGGEGIGLRRARGDERRLFCVEPKSVGVDAADRAAQRLPPFAHEERERMAAGKLADRRQDARARRLQRLRVEECRRLVGLERAERRDSREKDALPPSRREQRLRERRGGALGRHIDGRACQRERPARAGKPLDQFTVDERSGERRQERRANGNREDARVANQHANLSRRP